MGGALNGLWGAVGALRQKVLWPGDTSGIFGLDGWEGKSADYRKLRIAGRSGIFRGMNLHRQPVLELVTGMLVATITALADVFEHELARQSARIAMLESDMAARKAGGGRPTGKELDAKKRAARLMAAMERLPYDAKEAPTLNTRLLGLRNGVVVGTEIETETEVEPANDEGAPAAAD